MRTRRTSRREDQPHTMIGTLEPFERALKRARQREDSRNRESLYFPAVYERDLHLALAESATQTVDRVVICSSDRVDATEFRSAIWRDVASSGLRSRATYLLSHSGLIRTSLRDLVALDIEAGVEVRIIAIGDLSEAIALAMLTETVVIDSKVAAMAPRGASRDSHASWTVTASQEHVGEASRLVKDLWQLASPLDRLPTALNLDEPLAQSAPIISGVAPVLCVGDHIDVKGCAWYHGTWQFLRLMNMVSTPTWHHDFYLDAISAAVGRGAGSILITGTADYSVLAYAIDASRRVDAAMSDVTFTVVDLCGTPLFACQWYAKREGIVVETVADDLFRFADQTNRTYDLIITDAFLTRFVGNATERVLTAWVNLLADDGEVITTIRAHEETQAGQSSEEAVASFRERALVRWRRWESFVSIGRSEIATRAETYARKMVSNPIGRNAEIVNLLERHFSVDASDLVAVPGELFPTKYLRARLSKKGIG